VSKRIPIPFVGAFAESRARRVSAQRTVNLYPQVEKPGSRNVLALYSDPGLKPLTTAGLGPCRSNGVRWQGKLWFVSGAELVTIDSNGTATSIGTLDTNGGRVSIAAGRDAVGLVDGTAGYYYDGTAFAKIADADFPASPTHITWLDGYWIVNDSGTEKFQISALNDITSWSALEFASAEAQPDDIEALTANDKILYAIGDRSTQLFYNSGNPDFPFDPYQQAVPVGIAAPHSLVASSVGLFWLAQHTDGDVSPVRMTGAVPQVIGDSYTDWLISKMAKVSDAFGFVYKLAGHWFWQLTFPSADKTLVYSVNEGMWHERVSPGMGRHRAGGYGYLGRSHIVGNDSSGRCDTLDSGTFTDNGQTMERMRRGQVIHKNNRRMTFWAVVVGFDAGVGLTTGQGSDPQAMLRYSDDGGKTWSDELWTTIGPLGDYQRAAIWRQLGQSRERIFEVKVTDPVDVTIIDAYAEVEVDDA